MFFFRAVVFQLLFAGTAAAALSSVRSAAGPSAPPPPKTVWDRIMSEQSFMNLRKGYILMDSGRYPEAANEFLKALAINPDEPYAHILYGSSLYWLGEPDKAMGEFAAAAALDPRNPVAWQLMGIVHSWKGDYPAALEKFLKAAELAPERADVRMNAGSVYGALGEMDSALDNFRRAAALEPGNPLYFYQLGLLYARLGRSQEAKAAFKRAISLFGDYEDAMLELAVLQERDGDDKEAARMYRRALSVKPGDNVARFRLGCLLYRTGPPDRLPGLLEEAFLLTPSNVKGGISISLAYAGGPIAGGSAGPEKAEKGKAGPLESAVARIPADEDITVKAEFISIPKTRLAVRAEGKPGNRKAPEREIKYAKREYSLPASDGAGRAARAARIAAEMDKALKAAGGEEMDAKMSIKIETKKASLSPAAGEPAPGVVYKPRDVGNDMGLWVMGNNWLETVEEALDSLPEAARPAGEEPLRLLRGLGALIMGEPDAALVSFEGAGGAGADLGRCAAWTAKGEQEKALAACEAALKRAPKSKVAAANHKWLTSK